MRYAFWLIPLVLGCSSDSTSTGSDFSTTPNWDGAVDTSNNTQLPDQTLPRDIKPPDTSPPDTLPQDVLPPDTSKDLAIDAPAPVSVTGHVELHTWLPTGTTVQHIDREWKAGWTVTTLGPPPVSTTTAIDATGKAAYTLAGLPPDPVIELEVTTGGDALPSRSVLFSPKDAKGDFVVVALSKALLAKLSGSVVADLAKAIVLVYVEDKAHKAIAGATVKLWDHTQKLIATQVIYPTSTFGAGTATGDVYPVALLVNVPPAPAGAHYLLETTHPTMMFEDQILAPAAGVVTFVAPD